MRCFSVGVEEEVIALGLDSGDDLLESIEEAIEELDIKNGVIVSGIGSLSEAHYHIVDPGDEKPWKDRFIKKEGTIEFINLQGVIADGEPHLHIALAQNDQAFGGHLEKGCRILTVSEIIIKRVSGDMKRVMHDMGYGQLSPDI
ncbi:MAG: PPC domain-containing DNA-binding protein [Halanaerobiales bacterium]